MSLSRKVYATLPRYRTEQEFANAVISEVEPYFHVEQQVGLTHWTGRRLTVDAVLRPRDPDPWKEESPVFAVEFKLPFLFHTSDGWDSTRNFTSWAAQAVDYANSMWDGPPQQRLRIFTCPSATAPFEDGGRTNLDQPTLGDLTFYAPRLLWQLGVGELAKLEREGWTLLGSGNHVLWSERRGVQEGKRWRLTPQVGSR